MQRAIVVDASAVVDFLVDGGDRGEWVASQFVTDLHAPHLLDAEVTSALRRITARGNVSTQRARRALDTFGDLGITRYPMTLLLERVWALRDVLSAYDAMYVVLAEALPAPLVTTDGQLARTTGHRATILAPS